ncbi:MAG: hypothetical protein J3T61_06010, partial [Candidatus Brocadiales bacterium]|nr:hypothetical protein [Candidatus Bathyanammoxibius sp.]
RAQNQNSKLVFRFFTNAKCGVERKSPLPAGVSGIQVWESLRKRQAGDQKDELRAGIRALLKTTTKPESYSGTAWKTFQKFLDDSAQEEFQDFVDHFEWSTSQPDATTMSQSVVLQLQSLGLATDRDQAQELHARLFLFLVRLLGRQGPKRLSTADLKAQAALPTLSDDDRRQLHWLTTSVLAQSARLDEGERKIIETITAVAGLQNQVQQLAAASDIQATISPTKLEVSTSPPIRVQNAVSRRKVIQQLSATLSATSWLAIHGGYGTGKTQLLLELCGPQNTHLIWIRLREFDEDQAIQTIILALAKAIEGRRTFEGSPSIAQLVLRCEPGTYIVLDDLPCLSPGGLLAESLRLVVTDAKSAGIIIVSGSHYRLPQQIIDEHPDDLVCQEPVPLFDADESHELLIALGAPDTDTVRDLSVAASVACQGHPTLLAAVARTLVEREWDFSSLKLPELLTEEHAGEAVATALHRLLETVPDSETRELIYRLAIIIGEFGLEELTTVAHVVPQLQRPRERAKELEGLWLETLSGPKYSVCPLIKPLSETELSIELAKSLRRELAQQLMGRKSGSVVEIARAVRYLRLADEYDMAGVFLALVLVDTDALPTWDKKYLLMSSWGYESLPSQIRLSARILVRGKQLQLAAGIDEPLEYLLKDGERLIEQAEAESEWAALAFYVTSIVPVSQKDFKKSC